MARGRWGTIEASSTAIGRYQNFICRLGFKHLLKRFQPVGFARWLVPAQPIDAREAHRDAGFVPRRAFKTLEGDFQHQPLLRLVDDMAYGTEFLCRVAANKTVDLEQLLIGEAEIGLADRHQLLAALARAPDAEGVIRVIGGALAVPALRIHQHGIDDVRVAL